MLKRLVRLLRRLWDANVEVIETRRIVEWDKLWLHREDESEEKLTAVQLTIKTKERLSVLIRQDLSKYEADWLKITMEGDLTHLAWLIEWELEEARQLAVNAYKFLEENQK